MAPEVGPLKREAHPYSWKTMVENLELSVVELQNWVDDTVTRIVPFDGEDPYTIYTVSTIDREEHYFSVPAQQILLLFVRWLDKDFFEASHCLTEWEKSEGLDYYDRGESKVGKSLHYYELGAIYPFMMTHGSHLHPALKGLVQCYPEEFPEGPSDGGLLLKETKDEDGNTVVNTLDFKTVLEKLRNFQMPASAGKYTTSTLRNDEEYLPDGCRTFFDLSRDSPEHRLYKSIGPSNQFTAMDAYMYALNHAPRHLMGKRDETEEFYANFVNERLRKNDMPEYEFRKIHTLKGTDDADPAWTS